jgi:hypothetical protein
MLNGVISLHENLAAPSYFVEKYVEFASNSRLDYAC